MQAPRPTCSGRCHAEIDENNSRYKDAAGMD